MLISIWSINIFVKKKRIINNKWFNCDFWNPLCFPPPTFFPIFLRNPEPEPFFLIPSPSLSLFLKWILILPLRHRLLLLHRSCCFARRLRRNPPPTLTFLLTSIIPINQLWLVSLVCKDFAFNGGCFGNFFIL